MRRELSGAAGIVAASLCFQSGAAIAVPTFVVMGPGGTTAWRFLFAALLLAVTRRPRVRRHARDYWLGTAGLGIAIAVMTNSSYWTLSLLPQGAATTLEFLGPLGVAVATSRTRRHVWAALMAGSGVVAIGGATTQFPFEGLCLGLVTAAAFAGYVLLQARVGAPDLDRLALAFMIAAALSVPVAASSAAELTWHTVTLISLSSSVGVVLAYGLDAFAIHRLGARQAGVLLSLDPAMGVLSGYVLLGQSLGWPTLSGVGLVIASGMLSASAGSPRQRGGTLAASLRRLVPRRRRLHGPDSYQ